MGRFVLGHSNLASAAGTTFAGNPSGAAVANAGAGFEAENLGDPVPHRRWRSAAGVTMPVDIEVRPAKSERVGAFGVIGDNLSESAFLRIRADGEWVWRWAFTCTPAHVDSAATIDTAALGEATYELLARYQRGANSANQGSRIQEHPVFVLTSNEWNATDIEISIEVRNGRWRASLYRRNASAATIDGPKPSFGWEHIAVTVSGSGSVAELFVNGVSAGTVAISARGSSSAAMYAMMGKRSSSTTSVQICDVRIWSKVLPVADILGGRGDMLSGDEEGLYRWWPFEEGSGSSVAEKVAGGSATIDGTANWAISYNPFADYDSGIIERWHQWKRRDVMTLNGGAAGAGWESPAAFTVRPGVSFRISVRLLPRQSNAFQWIASIGEGLASTQIDWTLRVNVAGNVVLSVERYSGGATELVGPVIRDGLWHDITVVIKDATLEAFLYVNGTEYGPADISSRPYVFKNSQRICIGQKNAGGTPTGVGISISGDVLYFQRPLEQSEVETWLWRRVPAQLVDQVAARYEIEEGSTQANRGGVASSDLVINGAAAKITWSRRLSTDPNGVWFAGKISDYQTGGRASFSIAAPATVSGKRILFRFRDGANPENEISAGVLFAGEALELTQGFPEVVAGTDAPAFERTEAGQDFRGAGVFANRVTVDIRNVLSDAAAQELRHVLDRLGSRGEPVLVIARADQKFPRRLDTSAYGVPETGDTVFSRVVPSMPGSRRVVILEAPP